MFTSWWFYTYRSSFELRPRLVFTDGYKPDARVGQGTADVPNHCLERYSLDHHFHPLQKGATRGLVSLSKPITVSSSDRLVNSPDGGKPHGCRRVAHSGW